MVVCHCKAINDAEIREVLASIRPSTDDVAARCGAGTDCGGCRSTIDDLVERATRGLAG